MKTQDNEVLSVSTPADLLALVPYLLGFHPTDSLIVVALSGRRLVFIARSDLPADQASAATRAALVDQIATQTVGSGADAAVLVGYGPAAPVTAMVDIARDSFAGRGVQLREVLRVAGGRYYSYLCTDAGCCPPEGVAFDPVAGPAAVAATVAGMVALPDRQALAAQLAPVTGQARQAMRRATEHAAARLADLAGHGDPTAEVERVGRDAVDDALAQQGAGRSLADGQAAWLSLLLTHLPVRDHAWARTGTDEAHLRLWADLTRRAQPHLAAAPASLCAFAAWRRGNGALANVAVDRALRADPGYRMAQLIAETLWLGIPPHAFDAWPDLPDGDPPEDAGPVAGNSE